MKRIIVMTLLAVCLCAQVQAQEGIEEQLMEAADYDFALFESLAMGQVGIDFGYADKDGFGYLLYAVKGGKPETIEYLLDSGADVNASFKWGSRLATVLNFVEDVPTAALLIQRDIRLNEDLERYSSPLMNIAKYGEGDLIEFLIQSGLECETFDEMGASPLYTAIDHGRQGNASVLIKHGTEKTFFARQHNTHNSPFSLLMSKDSPKDRELLAEMIEKSWVQTLNDERMRELTEKGEAKTLGLPPLLFAMKAKNFDAVAMLIDKGVDLDLVDENGASLLMWAVHGGSYPIVRSLFEKGASLEAGGPIWIDIERGSYYGGLLQIAAQEQGPQMLDILRYLVEVCGIEVDSGEYDIQTKSRNTFTALFNACISGDPEKAEYLLSMGANPNAEYQGYPLIFYILSGSFSDERLPLLLINYGVLANGFMKELILWAAYKGYTSTAEYLLLNGADVNFEIDTGLTPIFFAAMNGHADMVRLFLECGADTERLGTVKDTKGLDAKMTVAEMTRQFLDANRDNREAVLKYTEVLEVLESAENRMAELQAEELQAEELRAQELQAEALRAQELQAEELQAEELRAQELQAEALLAEELRAQELQAEELQAEELQTQELQTQELQAEALRAEELQVEQLRAQELQAEELQAQELQAQELQAEALRAEELQVKP